MGQSAFENGDRRAAPGLSIVHLLFLQLRVATLRHRRLPSRRGMKRRMEGGLGRQTTRSRGRREGSLTSGRRCSGTKQTAWRESSNSQEGLVCQSSAEQGFQGGRVPSRTWIRTAKGILSVERVDPRRRVNWTEAGSECRGYVVGCGAFFFCPARFCVARRTKPGERKCCCLRQTCIVRREAQRVRSTSPMYL